MKSISQRFANNLKASFLLFGLIWGIGAAVKAFLCLCGAGVGLVLALFHWALSGAPPWID